MQGIRSLNCLTPTPTINCHQVRGEQKVRTCLLAQALY